MIKPEDLLLACEKLSATVNEKNISIGDYIQPRLDRDVLLTQCIFSAVRENRILQISIEEKLTTAEAFFKSTGIHDEERLLQVLYPLGIIDYDEAAMIFEHWVVELKDEKLVKNSFRKLFDRFAPPSEYFE